MKKTNTKKTLLISIIALMLCVALALGATYAWFTDSVTSGTNKIVAGNLDIEVYYATESDVADDAIADDNWKSLASADSIFTTKLWEPGATEVVYLKVVNKGTLDLKYKAIVSPVEEKGGVNVAGESFKLSDYLVFDTTENSTDFTAYTRDSARTALAGKSMGLTVESLTDADNTLAAGATEYFALLVYMPTDVGNDANYMTGTTPPEIDLGITVYATQAESESDSFGTDYDAGAVTASPYATTPTYTYSPQPTVAPTPTPGN